MIAPRVYALENIPSTLSAEDIAAVLRTVRQDRSPRGRRDLAILTLLATYGLRAGEITALRLDDIDWRREQVRVRHSKTGHETWLPLVRPVGEALVDYLQKGRPKVAAREIFIRARAPYRPFHNGSSLYSGIVRRLQAGGMKWQGKHGPHAFRHARAVSLLRAAVPSKVIGDVLGHRCFGLDSHLPETGHRRPPKNRARRAGGEVMTKWPDSNGAVFRRYVQGLGLRTAMAARVYHCILRGFQHFVSGYDPAFPVSQASLTAWIQDRITVWPLHLVIHRARLVDRFLDWLVSGSHIAENPLAKLRAEYRQHSTAPIVRALARSEPRRRTGEAPHVAPFRQSFGARNARTHFRYAGRGLPLWRLRKPSPWSGSVSAATAGCC